MPAPCNCWTPSSHPTQSRRYLPTRWGGGGLLNKTTSWPVGIPIGNLTSQLFANIYLDVLDQYIKHALRERYYVRYMDDFLILHPSKARLWELNARIGQFCSAELRLQLHPKKTNVHKFSGVERFVGYDLAPFQRRLSKPTVQRFINRMKRVQKTRGKDAMAESWQQFRAYSQFAHARGLLRSIDPAYQKDAG